ncbi:GntR family transcriptional regulator [Cryobacterium sp. Y57]|uniref:GntR family transcriptional regulator n=1 Tax=Cryobacterium sp. Y57 TaxID=2048287 RepID=UPI001304E7C1|nr:GntR family transcriptional regulator [Cryobacterium sp. Y57]
MAQDGDSNRGVYEALLSDISEGALEPGSWLREEALATRLGTSRTPVREALRALAAEGLVEVVRNKGARVRNWTGEELSETYGLRALLEGYAARRAAEKHGAGMFDQLQEAESALESALEVRAPGYLDEVAEHNAKFHRIVLEMAESSLLGGFISTLSSVAVVKRAFRGYTEADLARTVVQHRDILLAVRVGSGDLAETAMRSHIYAAMYSASTALHNDG